MDKATYGVTFDDGSMDYFENIVEYHTDDKLGVILLKDEKGHEVMINWNHVQFVYKYYCEQL